MSVSITLLDEKREQEYDEFIRLSPISLLYASSTYRRLLRRFLDAEDTYFIALNSQNEIVGALPSFIKRDKSFGSVINSLPFYGSNGAVIVRDAARSVAGALLEALNEFAISEGCIASTIITSPLETDLSVYDAKTAYTFIDSRIGQLTSLPRGRAEINRRIMEMIHSKTRNMVRKAEKSGISVVKNEGPDALSFIASEHQKNMIEIGGIAKPARFFELVNECMKYGVDYCTYTAYLDATPVAGLLLMMYNGIVEYFTPVIVKEYRSLQPLSLIIYQAMCDFASSGFRLWNWGGTWLSQKGVYDFKKRWGTQDYPYKYYTRVYDDKVLKMSKDELLTRYPYFYVVPFSELKV